MTNQEIEKEIQARVNFKMNELLTNVTNMANTNWGIVVNSGHPKYHYYFEAFKQFKQILIKEKNLPLPYDRIHEHNKKEYRDKIIEKLEKRLLKRGTQSYPIDMKVLIEGVEEAMNFEKNYKHDR